MGADDGDSPASHHILECAHLVEHGLAVFAEYQVGNEPWAVVLIANLIEMPRHVTDQQHPFAAFEHDANDLAPFPVAPCAQQHDTRRHEEHLVIVEGLEALTQLG